MINFDYVTIEKIKEHNPNWPQIPDHPYKISLLKDLELEKQIHYLV